MTPSSPPETSHAACQCGQTQIALHGPPITVCDCYCDSCRAAAAEIEALPGAAKILGADGATRFVLQKKSKVSPISGAGHLREYRLKPDAPTRRVVATCCNSAMFLDFKHAHWISVYAGCLPAQAVPPLEERTMLSDMPSGFSPPADGARNSKRQSLTFYAKLLGAWAAMGFRTPVLDFVEEAAPDDR